MTIHDFLSKLHGVKETARGKAWQALCPAHDDREASLSISLGDDDRILLHCHAGCETKDICGQLGILMKSLFPDRKPTRQIVATYDYQDASGRLLFQVVRYDPKDFRQRKPDGNGGWVWKLGNTQPTLYRLPQVIAAIQANAPVLFCEGEKDADNAWNKLGVEATTAPMGAGKWRKHYAEYLTDAKIIIVPDNDDPGRQHADLVAEALQGIAKAVRVVNLPDLPPKGDLSDWIAAGGTRDQLFDIVKQTPNWTPSEKPREVIKLTPTDLSDTGNARRLVARFDGDMLFRRDTGKWLIWNGEYWQPDEDGEMVRRAQNTIESLYELVGHIPQDQEAKLLSHIHKCLYAQRLEAMIRVAQSVSGVTRQGGEFDAQPFFLCVQNGVLDLQTGKLSRVFDRSLMLSKQIQIHYDPDAQCTRWQSFLEEVQPDPEVRAYLQRAVGYTLTADISEHCLFFLYGPGSNGKSTFIETIRKLVGDYYTKVNAETITAKKWGSSNTNDIAALRGMRMVSASELSKYKHLDEGLVKDMTGGDEVRARFLYQEGFTFNAGFKLWLYGNEKPRINGTDEGIWRRIRLIPWTVQVPEEKIDKHLSERLQLELPGILAWAVEGCLMWQQHGLGSPSVVTAASADYRNEQDTYADFIETCCELGPNCRCTKAELWTEYRKFLGNPDDLGHLTFRLFNSDIGGRAGISTHRGGGGVKMWVGLRLKSDRVTESDSPTIKSPHVRNHMENFIESESPSVTRSLDLEEWEV